MSYIGDFTLGDTIDTSFCTVQSTGAPTTLSGSPVISAYVGNSTTQITAGITLTVDFDSVTGYNHVRIVASGGNGYAAASNYRLVITTGTVNSVSAVGYVVAEFSIQNRFTNVAQINSVSTSPVTTIKAVQGLAVDGVVPTVTAVTGLTASDVGAIKTKTDFLPSATAGAAGGVFIAGTNAATTVTTSFTTTFTGNLTGSVASVTGNVGGNVVGSVASVTGNVGGNVVGSVASVVGAVGSVTGLTASNLDATVSSRATPAQVATALDNTGITVANGVTKIAGVTVHTAGTGGQSVGA